MNKKTNLGILELFFLPKGFARNKYRIMILEVAILSVKPGLSAKFERAFDQAGPLISSINGYIKHSLRRCVEKEDQYILMVEWQELQDHTIGFRQSEVYQEWKALLHHFYDPFPVVEHYEKVLDYPKYKEDRTS